MMRAMTTKMAKPSRGFRAARFALGCGALLFVAASFPHSFAQEPARRITAPTRTGATGAGLSVPLSSPTRPSDRNANRATGDATRATTTIASAAKPAAAPPPSSSALGSVRLDGLEYIDLVRFSKMLGLTVTWTKAAEQLTLRKTGTKIEVTGDSREFQVNDIRVFAGNAIRIYKRGLWISRIDADKLLAPLASQGAGQRIVPRLKTIAIDAGHGGIDKGKINERLKIFEKTVTLDTASRLKTLLEKQGYKVVMTRTSDKKVELGDRPEIATKAGADLFVSIHFNSVESSPQSVAGIEVYRFSPRYQPPITRTSALTEDKIGNPGDADAYWSALLGFKIHQSMLSDLNASDRGFKHHKFAVLRLATCPAVLVEAGFLSNDAEARKISTAAHRQKIAEAIADGIKDYATALSRAKK